MRKKHLFLLFTFSMMSLVGMAKTRLLEVTGTPLATIEFVGKLDGKTISQKIQPSSAIMTFRVDTGSTVTLTADVKDGAILTSWGGDVKASTPAVKVVMDKNKKASVSVAAP